MWIMLLVCVLSAVFAGVQEDWGYCLMFSALVVCCLVIPAVPVSVDSCLCCPNPRFLGGEFCHDCRNEMDALDTHMAETHESLLAGEYCGGPDDDYCDHCGDPDCYDDGQCLYQDEDDEDEEEDMDCFDECLYPDDDEDEEDDLPTPHAPSADARR